MTMLEQFMAAKRAAAPIVAIRTPDPASTVKTIFTCFGTEAPVAQWNIITGVVSMNSLAAPYVNSMNVVDGQTMPAAMVTGNPVEALRLSLERLPAKSILFFHNAHFYVEKGPGDGHKPVIQAIWNVRDPFKSTQRVVVLMAPQIEIPEEIRNDVVVIDEPLPTDKELAAIVVRSLGKAGKGKPGKKVLGKLVNAVSGLAAFNADTVISMSVNADKKIDMEAVWHQKIKIIEQEKGLKVHRGGSSFADIGGNDNLKHLLLKIAKGQRCPLLVVFIDEIEKALAAAGTDTTGVTTDQLKVLLTEMQDNDWTGIIIYGFAGTGKSELAKAFGNEARCPTIEADLGSMKNIWVGSSEARMRAFVKTVKAMGKKQVFFIATCNHVQNLRPEFKRRFRKGIFFCDLPAEAERKIIWDIYFKKFEIPATAVKPNDEGWTGAEIRLCCENSHEFGISLREAAKFMTITSQAMGKEVEEMRQAASGKYVDAQNPGIYHYEKKSEKGPGFFQKMMTM